jgi:hypothetical protein
VTEPTRQNKNTKNNTKNNKDAGGGRTGEGDALDLAELELGLVVLDGVDGKAALGIVQQAVVLLDLGDRDDVCVPSPALARVRPQRQRR